jgi:hypothetical protein
MPETKARRVQRSKGEGASAFAILQKVELDQLSYLLRKYLQPLRYGILRKVSTKYTRHLIRPPAPPPPSAPSGSANQTLQITQM